MPRLHILCLDCSTLRAEALWSSEISREEEDRRASAGRVWLQWRPVQISKHRWNATIAAVIAVNRTCCAVLNSFDTVNPFICIGDQATVAYSTIGRTKDRYARALTDRSHDQSFLWRILKTLVAFFVAFYSVEVLVTVRSNNYIYY